MGDLGDQVTCPICLNSIDKAFTFLYGCNNHAACIQCIFNHTSETRSPACPICRAPWHPGRTKLLHGVIREQTGIASQGSADMPHYIIYPISYIIYHLIPYNLSFALNFSSYCNYCNYLSPIACLCLEPQSPILSLICSTC